MNKTQKRALELFNGPMAHVKKHQWYAWRHPGKTLTHCDICLNLEDCWFYGRQIPEAPLHFHCECYVEPITPKWSSTDEAHVAYALGNYKLSELGKNGQKIIIAGIEFFVRPNGKLENVIQ